MIESNIIPLSSLGFEGREIYSTINPLSALQRSEQEASTREELPLTFSEERAQMPVLLGEGKTIDSNIFVLANLNAQFMNSPLYFRRHRDKKSGDIIDDYATSMSASMVVYSTENDTFVYHSRNESESTHVLQRIGESFEKIDVHLSHVFWPVASVDEWIDRYAGKVNVLPSVLDPDLLLKYAPTGSEKSLKTLLLAQSAAYTKHGVQLLWKSLGVPTPHTQYVDLHNSRRDSIEQDIHRNFSQYEDVVMNIVDGSGGYATVFSPQEEISFNLSHEYFEHQRLQVQGALPLITSPGYIANIGIDGSIKHLLVSRQIFAEPGAHAGNIWEEGYNFDLLDPNFSSANLDAVLALSQAGVVGQVIIDSLIVTEQDAQKYGVPQTTFREANIRPGGSSVINRIRQGAIEGKRITSVLTSTKIPVSKKDVLSGKFENLLTESNSVDTCAVMYNYNTDTGYASVAIAGAEVPTEVLNKQQIEILKKLT